MEHYFISDGVYGTLGVIVSRYYNLTGSQIRHGEYKNGKYERAKIINLYVGEYNDFGYAKLNLVWTKKLALCVIEHIE